MLHTKWIQSNTFSLFFKSRNTLILCLLFPFTTNIRIIGIIIVNASSDNIHFDK